MPAPGVPRATYRLQFHRGFGFADATAIVPYLARLGISHVYASPVLMARPGSTHGYDITDFNRLNPELGDDAAFDALVDSLHAHDMGLIVDFVPNHMGVGSDNPWWFDVLEWGRASPYAAYFDIDWEATARGPRGKVLLPVLGDHYGTLLEAGELNLRFEAESGRLVIRYHEHRFPIALRHYGRLLLPAAGRLGAAAEDLLQLIERFGGQAQGGAARARRPQHQREGAELRSALAALASDPDTAQAIAAAVDLINGTPGRAETFRLLHRLLDEQHYRLAFWRVASAEINYRRFFDVNDLAGLRVERPEVFEATHRLLLQLIASGKVQGVRLDHIDGLYDPVGYCRRLLARAGEEQARAGAPGGTGSAPIYLVVEKILAGHEQLRDELPVDGTTGYEFLNLVNGLFVDPVGERGSTTTYHRFVGEELDLDAIIATAKAQVLRYTLDGELHVLAHELHRLAGQSWSTLDYTLTVIRDALTEVIVHFPVYRTYVTASGGQAEDRRDLDWALARARRTSGLVDRTVFDFLHRALSTDLRADRRYRKADVVAAAMRFQQLTGPVMAKALEDTAFYRYLRLVSLNEVGGEPGRFGITPATFHRTLAARRERHPATMLASATHDHKRGADVRARIDVLSELPQEWRRRVGRWSRLNRTKRGSIDHQPVPSRNDEYLIYQTLIGAWPLEITTAEDPAIEGLAERIVGYMVKACREAKLRTSWTAPDAAYEAGVEHFVRRLLDRRHGRPFLADFLPFHARIARVGAVGGLAQALITLTAPGIPDCYQGCELFDLSLVDPDNRRPVDFARRARALERPEPPGELLRKWRDGRIKQHVMARSLALRRAQPELFLAGDYLPLATAGAHGERVVAYARTWGEAALVVVAPRLVAPLLDATELPLPEAASWADTRVVLPESLVDRTWTDPLTDRREDAMNGSEIMVADALVELPVALLSSVHAGQGPARVSAGRAG